MPDDWEYVGAQDSRIIDVVALGPFMIWFALKARGVPQWSRTAMMVSGILTIVYNGANYFARQDSVAEKDWIALLDDPYSDGV